MRNHGISAGRALAVLWAGVFLFGCGGSKSTSVSTGTTGTAAGTTFPDPFTASLEPGHAYAVFDVENRGRFVIRLEEEAAPKTVARFEALVTEGFYDGKKFHRVEEYLVQTGRTDGEKPPSVEGEMFGQTLKHVPGAVGLARLVTDYNSGTTQFYIMKERKPNWNQEYTLFGTVVQGMDTVSAIRRGDEILSAAIVEM